MSGRARYDHKGEQAIELIIQLFDAACMRMAWSGDITERANDRKEVSLKMAKPIDNEVITLHRYYIWANRMRTHFDAVLARREETSAAGFPIEAHMYMSLWYSCLYVVIEGWRKLGLKDETICTLLESPNTTLLRRYRNGVFHFQPKYFDRKSLGLIEQGENVVNWVRTLNHELGRFFLQCNENQRKTPLILTESTGKK